MTNATDTAMHWRGGHDLTSLVGRTVKLEVSLEGDAIVEGGRAVPPAAGGVLPVTLKAFLKKCDISNLA